MVMQLNPEPPQPPIDNTNQPQANTSTQTTSPTAPSPHPQPVINPEQPKILGPNIAIISVAVLIVLIALYLYLGNSNSVNTPPTTVGTTAISVQKPILSITTLINRSNALFSMPDQQLFVLSYNYTELSPPPPSKYTAIGTIKYVTSSYGLNFTDTIVNYSLSISPYEYNISSNESNGNYPIAVFVSVSKFNTPNNATSEYLGLVRNSMGLGYNYSHHLNALNYSNHKGDINFSYPEIYYVNNGLLIQINGTNATQIIKSNTLLSDYLNASLVPYSSSINVSTPILFTSTVHPIYGSLLQEEVAIEYQNYVLNIYTLTPISKFNQSYTKTLAVHLLNLIENNTYV